MTFLSHFPPRLCFLFVKQSLPGGFPGGCVVCGFIRKRVPFALMVTSHHFVIRKVNLKEPVKVFEI